LIGAAINLYLTRIEMRRSDVEFAQLARQMFVMIGNDLRAASEYKPQSMTGALAAAGSASAFNVNQIDNAANANNANNANANANAGGQSGASSSTSSSTSSLTGVIDQSSMVTTPGVYGTLQELYVDTSRPPGHDQLLRSYAGYPNIPAVELPDTDAATSAMSRTGLGQNARTPKSDLKTVHYFLRKGEEITDPASVAVTGLSPEAQNRAGGLVRQEIDRAQWLAAQELGDQATLESGQKLLAPEVVAIEFRYFDGTQVLDTWDTKVSGGLPPAVEVRIWIADPKEVHAAEAAGMGMLSTQAAAREFRQTIFLPLAKPAASTSTSGTSSTSATSGTGAAP
jgi:hypothetical protein